MGAGGRLLWLGEVRRSPPLNAYLAKIPEIAGAEF